MSSAALESQGMKIYVGDVGSPNNFVAIPEIKSISGPDGSAPLRDVTDLDSTAKEFEPGLKDEGSLQLSVMFVPQNAVHKALRDAWSNRTLKAFYLLFADSQATKWLFSGYVTAVQGNFAVDESAMATITIKITGAIEQTP